MATETSATVAADLLEQAVKENSEGLAVLNVGCGKILVEGAVNLDGFWNPDEKVVRVSTLDVMTPDGTPQIPYDDDTFDVIQCTHVLEHIQHLLPLLQELYRVAKPDCTLLVAVPYGSSDDAYEDPTHVRRFYPGSFLYFGQKAYWRATYGYTGDWKPQLVNLFIDKLKYPAGEHQAEQIQHDLIHSRNVVHEMRAVFGAVKPAREAIEGEMDTWETHVTFIEPNHPEAIREKLREAGPDARETPELITP